MIINEDYRVYYDWRIVKINYDIIENRLSKLKMLRYSNSLISLLEVLICPTEVNRTDIDRTYNAVSNRNIGAMNFPNPDTNRSVNHMEGD